MRDLILLLLSICVLSGCGTVGKAIDRDRESRKFDIEYVVDISDAPVGEKIDIWIPYPSDDDHQDISNFQIIHGGCLNDVKSSRNGKGSSPHGNNSMYHITGTVEKPAGQITLKYSAERFVNSVDLMDYSTVSEVGANNDSIYLKPSTLCFVTPQIKNEAEALSALSPTTVGKARRFYDHILNQMSYSKAGQGWGRGDIYHACEVGEGNCTDFHTYFSALCMAVGIESRFQIGMWGKYSPETERYKTGGYHCWAEFHVPGKGWVPVDISEADKDVANKNNYFGSQTANRVTLSTGRDLTLTPAQAAGPINFFVNPYAEINGKPFTGITKFCYWQDR